MSSRSSHIDSASPLELPRPWLWRCHKCGLVYSLGVTRRCLNDGHYFCAGTTINRKTGELKKHNPCSSTFDYSGWEEYNEWRQHQITLQTGTESSPFDPYSTTSSETSSASSFATHNCERDCNFPSECNSKRQSAAQITMKPRKAKKTKISSRIPAPTSNPTSTVIQSAQSLTSKLVATPEQAVSVLSSKPNTGFSIRRVSRQQQRSFSLPLLPSSWFLTPTELPNPRRDTHPVLHGRNRANDNPQPDSSTENGVEAELAHVDTPAPLRIRKQSKDNLIAPLPTDHVGKTSRYNLRSNHQLHSEPQVDERVISIDGDVTGERQSPVQLLLDWNWSVDSVTGAWSGFFGTAGD